MNESVLYQKKRFDDYLEHHGIEGQKWGIRRYQNPDGSLTPEGIKRYRQYTKIMDKKSKKVKDYTKTSDLVAKTLPAGMTIRRITTADENLNGSRLAYFSYTAADKNNIRAITPWLMDVRGKSVNDAVEKNYTLNSDIKIPSQKEVDDIMRSIVKDPKERKEVVAASIMDRYFGARSDTLYYLRAAYDKTLQQKTIDAWVSEGRTRSEAEQMLKTNMEYSVDLLKQTKAEGESIVKNIADDKILQTSDYHYGKQLITMAFGSQKNDYQEKVVNELKKRGYNGMYDNAMISAGTENMPEAYEPIIIFDPGKNLTESKKSEKMNYEKVEAAEYKYRKWQKPIINKRDNSGYDNWVNDKYVGKSKASVTNEIKSLRSSGKSISDIAKQMGFSTSAVEYYLTK